MKTTACEQRDGYLGKWLSDEEGVEFEAHLALCSDCRQFLQEQRRLDDLLAQANATLLPLPASLTDTIGQRLRQARRRRVTAWATGLAAASIFVCVLAAWFRSPVAPKEEPVRSPVVALPTPQPEPMPDPRSLVHVTFPPTSDVIAVPQETDDPSVTIIWVYPTIKTAQETSPAPTDSFQPSERNGI